MLGQLLRVPRNFETFDDRPAPDLREDLIYHSNSFKDFRYWPEIWWGHAQYHEAGGYDWPLFCLLWCQHLVLGHWPPQIYIILRHRSRSTLAHVMACAWWQQVITWTNLYFSLVRFCGIHLGAISQWVPKLLFSLMHLQIHTFILSFFKITATSPRYQWVKLISFLLYAIIDLEYCKISNIRRTLVGDKIVYHSDVFGASPVGAAPTTSSSLT